MPVLARQLPLDSQAAMASQSGPEETAGEAVAVAAGASASMAVSATRRVRTPGRTAGRSRGVSSFRDHIIQIMHRLLHVVTPGGDR
ncbi:hypothetical protein GCM10023220_28590 [Streptomyces ziwulingensis]|uniref:Uncharacterized protein n=1 Tax=Streptomyces ziwulingensis TaxID=1045501 RepID=A0ABP9BTX6_9ACTN